MVRSLLIAAIAGLAFSSAAVVFAQPKPATPRPGTVNVQDPTPTEAGPETVQIKREALRLIDPKHYQVGLQLEPIEWLQLAAPMDGVIASLPQQTGQKVEAQAEVIRLDRTELDLAAEKAKAEYRAANVDLRRAKAKGEADGVEVAEAHLAAADAALKLAQHRLDRSSIRTPFAGQVYRIFVVPGQVVRTGEPLAQIGNPRQLKVEIPLDRKDAAAGKSVQIKIEDKLVEGKIREVQPLAARFEPIRELLDSAVSAVVVVDNDKGTYQSGQTVYAALIPRRPVAEIPTAAIANTGDGGRKVQVVREDAVRDIPVDILGPVGADRVYVSGAFAEYDELVASTSKELTDGTRVRLLSSPPAGGAAATRRPGAGTGATGTAGQRPNF